MDLALIAVCGAAFYYLSYRAVITQFLWSRYPVWLDSLLSCPACSGFWVGCAVGLDFYWRGHAALGLRPGDPGVIPLAGAVSLVATPLLAFVHILALERLGAEGYESSDGQEESRER